MTNQPANPSVDLPAIVNADNAEDGPVCKHCGNVEQVHFVGVSGIKWCPGLTGHRAFYAEPIPLPADHGGEQREDSPEYQARYTELERQACRMDASTLEEFWIQAQLKGGDAPCPSTSQPTSPGSNAARSKSNPLTDAAAPVAETQTPETDAAQIASNIQSQADAEKNWPWDAINRGWDFARNLELQRNESNQSLPLINGRVSNEARRMIGRIQNGEIVSIQDTISNVESLIAQNDSLRQQLSAALAANERNVAELETARNERMLLRELFSLWELLPHIENHYDDRLAYHLKTEIKSLRSDRDKLTAELAATHTRLKLCAKQIDNECEASDALRARVAELCASINAHVKNAKPQTGLQPGSQAHMRFIVTGAQLNELADAAIDGQNDGGVEG